MKYRQLNNSLELPSYVDNRYRDLAPWWNFVLDMYTGRSSWVKFLSRNSTENIVFDNNYEMINRGYRIDVTKSSQYLPKEADEDDDDWLQRISRSNFRRKFGDAIDSFAGLLTNYTIRGSLPASLNENIEDVDMKGNSLSKFLLKADIAAIRDGFCLILVDFPRTVTDEGESVIKTVYDSKQAALRPRLVMYTASQIVNYSLNQKTRAFEHVTVREYVEIQNGYGYDQVEQYLTLRPDRAEINRVVENELVTSSFPVKSPSGLMPIAIYTASVEGDDPLHSKPPLLDLAELNLTLYQKESQKDELMLRCNIPILAVKELTSGRKKAVDPETKVKIGPSTILWNVEATYVEPTGAALALTQADLVKLEASISERTLNFISLGVGTRTATEIVHSAAPLSATFSTMADAKKSAVQVIFETWGQFMSEPTDATIELDNSIVQAALDTPKVLGLLSLRQAGELSRKTFLDIMLSGKVLPHGTDIEAEMERIAVEARTQPIVPTTNQSSAFSQPKVNRPNPPIPDPNNVFT